MAFDAVEKVKAAEKKADEIINTSKEEAKRLLAEAQQQAAQRRSMFEKKLRADNYSAVQVADEKAAKITEAAKANAARQCEKLADTLSSQKDKAVEIVVKSALG